MQKQIVRGITLSIIVAVFGSMSFQSHSQEAQPSGEGKEIQSGEVAAPKKEARFPFRGKISKVDKKTLTISLAGKEKDRRIQLTPKTKIIKSGKPATLADAVIGEEAAGLIARDALGKEEVVSIRLGPKPDPEGRTTTGSKPSPETEPEEP